MALTPNTENSTSGKQPEKNRTVSDYIEIIAGWIVDIISIPLSFVSHILAQFVTPGSSGTQILGALGFFIGTLLSTDGIWQSLFQGVPLFPWFGAARSN